MLISMNSFSLLKKVDSFFRLNLITLS